MLIFYQRRFGRGRGRGTGSLITCPVRFGGVWGQCRAGCPYPVHKFRCSEAGRLIGECVIENCPIGDLGQTRSGSLHRTGVFVARLITHAHFQNIRIISANPANAATINVGTVLRFFVVPYR